MVKITEPGYYLPVVHAFNPLDIMATGTNLPQLITGVCEQTLEESEYVIKYMGAGRMYAGAAAKELIAICMAAQMDFPVPDPAIINVSSQFLDNLSGSPAYALAAKSIGNNFGSSYLDFSDGATFLTGNLSATQARQIPDIFAFDMFIQNADRSNAKPNMLTDGEKIYLIDHEMAFGFSLDIFPDRTPWIIKDRAMEWITKHIFYQHLVGKNENFDNFAQRLDSLNEEFWARLIDIVPSEWQDHAFPGIIRFLQSIIEHKAEFIEQIKMRLI